jgi:hypothetical protein
MRVFTRVTSKAELRQQALGRIGCAVIAIPVAYFAYRFLLSNSVSSGPFMGGIMALYAIYVGYTFLNAGLTPLRAPVNPKELRLTISDSGVKYEGSNWFADGFGAPTPPLEKAWSELGRGKVMTTPFGRTLQLYGKSGMMVTLTIPGIDKFEEYDEILELLGEKFGQPVEVIPGIRGAIAQGQQKAAERAAKAKAESDDAAPSDGESGEDAAG